MKRNFFLILLTEALDNVNYTQITFGIFYVLVTIGEEGDCGYGHGPSMHFYTLDSP